jgi:hypothetical protein
MELNALGEQQNRGEKEENLVSLGEDKAVVEQLLEKSETVAESSQQQPLLSIDVSETLGGEAGSDLVDLNNSSSISSKS